MRLFPHTKNTSIKIITDTYDLERCFFSSHSKGSLQIGKAGVFGMNLSTFDKFELFSKELQRYMSPGALEQLVREIGFVQRKSKYRAQDLVALCVWLGENIANAPLTQLCG